MPDDAELLRRFACDGDGDAFHELVQRRFGLVYAVALRQVGGDEHLARDVAQRAFIALARQAVALSKRAVISGWLYRTARYTAIDVVRAERRRRIREQEAHLMHENHMPAGDTSDVDWQGLRPVLDDILSELDERDRDAVMLRILEERPFTEVGAALRLTEDAARMRVDRALEKLRLRLRRRGVTSTTAALTLALGHQALAAPPAGLAAAVAGMALTNAKLATGAAAVGGALSFMSTTKFIGAASGMFAAVALGVATFHARDARRADELASSFEREIGNLRQQSAALRSQRVISNPDSSAAESRKLPRTSDPAAPTGTSSLTAQAASLRANYEARQRMRADPAFQQLSIRATRAATRIDYAPFFRSLNLTPDQIEVFEDLMVDRAWGGIDISGARLDLGLQHNDPAVLQESQRQDRDFQARMREHLGDTVAEAFLQYESDAPLRNLASNLAGSVYHTESPLTDTQAKQLSQIVGRHYPNLENIDQRWRTDPTSAEAILRDAQEILSPTQMKALRAQFANRRWVVESVWELNRPAAPAP